MNRNFSNRLVRTRMLGGVAGAQPIMAAPYADLVFTIGAASAGSLCGNSRPS